MAELAALRMELAEQAKLNAGVEFESTGEADDFAADALIEIGTAVERYGRPADSLRWMCRHQGCGVKRGGRWLVSIPRLQHRLNGG